MSDNKYKHPEGRATLFVNKYKEKETQPDLKGTMTDLDGNEFEIAGWKGKTQNGEDKIKVKPKMAKTKFLFRLVNLM